MTRWERDRDMGEGGEEGGGEREAVRKREVTVKVTRKKGTLEEETVVGRGSTVLGGGSVKSTEVTANKRNVSIIKSQ